jgi:hypothetical protein
MGNKPIIGWREWATFPGLGVEKVNAKIDTGARTSAIHAFRIKEKVVDGIPHVTFSLHPIQRRKIPEIFCSVPIADKRVITSSNGQKQNRIVIKTPMTLGGRTWPIELTLTDRDEMTFRLLIGREALRNRFLIDASGSHRLGQPTLSEES